MRSKRRLCAAALALVSSIAIAQEPYPSRPVRVVVAFAPGGGTDIVARALTAKLSARFGQQFVVDNRPGGGGVAGIELVARAQPNGYTLLVVSSSFAANAVLRKTPYDPINGFQPISLLSRQGLLVLVHPSVPVNTLKDLIALAKAKPGTVSFASSGQGSILHMAAELLVALSGTRMLHVPYKGVADAYPAVMSGDVNWVLGFPISALPLVKAGRLKALAITSTKRSKVLPDLPTVAESGVPGYEVQAWFGMFAPARTPADIVAKLNAEARRAMQAPDVVKRITADGAEVVGTSPEEFATHVRAEWAKWRDLVKRPGMTF